MSEHGLELFYHQTRNLQFLQFLSNSRTVNWNQYPTLRKGSNTQSPEIIYAAQPYLFNEEQAKNLKPLIAKSMIRTARNYLFEINENGEYNLEKMNWDVLVQKYEAKKYQTAYFLNRLK